MLDINRDAMAVPGRAVRNAHNVEIIVKQLADGSLAFALFNRCTEARVPSNITIMKLPAYSPELNPIENLWHYLRSHHWSNRFYKDYDTLFDAAANPITTLYTTATANTLAHARRCCGTRWSTTRATLVKR